MTTEQKERDAGVSVAEIRANLLKWIEDLETTNATQGKSALRPRVDAYCCLGRACEVMQWPWIETAGVFGAQLPYDGGTDWYEAALNRETQQALGITDSEETTLMEMNDGGKTFPEIAAWLRENVLPRYPEKAAVESVSPASL